VSAESLRDRVAIVTGGSSGIGRAVCLALATEGARVIAVGRTPARVEETRAALLAIPGVDPGGCLALALDVRSDRDMETMAEETLARFGRIDILVASAGIGSNTATSGRGRAVVADLSTETWDEVIDTNLKGTFLADRAVLPAMMRQGRGEIVNVSSSLAATSGWPFASAYCASKFGLMGLSESLAAEVAGYGIRVQVVLPDVVDTPMLRASHLAIRRALSSTEVAGFILEMLAAPENALLLNPLMVPFDMTQGPGRRSVFLR